MQLELFDVATHYPFELDEQYPIFKSIDEENYFLYEGYLNDICSCQLKPYKPNSHLTDWSKQ